MIRVRITTRARRILEAARLFPEQLGWTFCERSADVTVVDAGEVRAAVKRGVPNLLVLATPDRAPGDELFRSSPPCQVVFAPFRAAELKARVQWLLLAADNHVPTENELAAVRLQNAGRVASFLSHETRNALSYAWTNSIFIRDALKEGKAPDPDMISAATDTEEGISRALEAARTMLDLSRGERLTTSATDVNAVARRTVQLLTSRSYNMPRIELALTEVPQALGHQGGLTQVLTNLVLNAQDAAGERGLVQVCSLHEAKQVTLVVADSGPGLSPEASRRLFRAFATTKPGRGTGLGLAVSHWIVRSLGGRMEAVPEGRLGGAEFRVVLQAA